MRRQKPNKFVRDVLFDPQTSGGLLISANPAEADSLVNALQKGGVVDACIIGDIVDDEQEKIYVA